VASDEDSLEEEERADLGEAHRKNRENVESEEHLQTHKHIMTVC